MTCNLPNKVSPTFIGTKQAPLSCDEYDNNLRILLERSNHNGQQSYISICDFNEGVETAAAFQSLTTLVNNNSLAIQNLNTILSTGGTIANDLNNLRTDLQSQINQINGVNNVQNTKINNLETSFSNILDFINSLGNLDLGPLTLRVSNLETITSNHSNSIAQLTLSNQELRDDLNTSITQLTSELEADLLTSTTNITTAFRKNDNDLLYLINKLKSELDKVSGVEIPDVSDLQGILANSGNFVPIGSVISYAGNTAPTNYLLCEGQQLLISDYQELYNAIGLTYSNNPSAGTFTLPNLKQRIPVGKDPNVTQFDILGKTGGEVSTVLTLDQMPTHEHIIPDHTHTLNDPGHSHGIYASPWNYQGNRDGGATDSLATDLNNSFFSSIHGALGIAFEVEGNTDNTSINYDNKTVIGASNTNANGIKFPDDPGHRFSTSGVLEKTYVYSNYKNDFVSDPWPFIKVTPTDITIDPATTLTTDSIGTNQAHNNLQPYITLNYIIRVK